MEHKNSLANLARVKDVLDLSLQLYHYLDL